MSDELKKWISDNTHFENVNTGLKAVMTDDALADLLRRLNQAIDSPLGGGEQLSFSE